MSDAKWRPGDGVKVYVGEPISTGWITVDLDGADEILGTIAEHKQEDTDE